MRNLVLVLLFFLFSGCATVQTRVSAFHELEQPLLGSTYALVPIKEQDGSLEFKTYARLVKAELGKRGMIETTREQAQYTILMSYGVDDGKQVVSSRPIYGQTGTVKTVNSGIDNLLPSIGAGRSHTTGTITSYGGNTATYNSTTSIAPSVDVGIITRGLPTTSTPTYGIVGSETMTTTEYARNLNIFIVDNAKSVDGKPYYVYEGKAISSGTTGQLAPIMPAMVRSVFEDFPGKSGSSRTSVQPLEE